MFGSENSIEPVRAVAAVAVTADGRGVARAMVDKDSIREATPDDLASAARRALGKATSEPTPVKAVADAKGGLFRRRPTEPEKPDVVAQQLGLYTADKRSSRVYFSDFQQKQEVMRADPKRITSKLDDKQTVSAMLDLAQSRGWDTVRLKGTKDFQSEAWVQSQVRGMKPEGYKPTATDQQEAARRIAAASPVQAAPAPVQAAESKASAGAGASRYTMKVTNSVSVAGEAQKGETAPVKAAAPAPAASTKAVPVTIQASTAAAAPAKAAPDKAAPVAAQAPKAAAAPAQEASTKAAPAAVQASTAAAAPARAARAKAASAAVQAPTAAASDGAAADRVKVVPVQRKSVWGAVEATGKQARAADAATATAKATAKAGERPTSATTA